MEIKNVATTPKTNPKRTQTNPISQSPQGGIKQIINNQLSIINVKAQSNPISRPPRSGFNTIINYHLSIINGMHPAPNPFLVPYFWCGANPPPLNICAIPCICSGSSQADKLAKTPIRYNYQTSQIAWVRANTLSKLTYLPNYHTQDPVKTSI